MSIALMFDEIIMNILSKTALGCRVEVVDSDIEKQVTKKMYMYRWSLQYFYCKKGPHESLGIFCPNFNVEK